MIILRVACDNLYMFKDFEVDFTYNRQINHPLSENERIFEGSKIKVKKSLIIMGANASGKTTFGRLMCLILNFINGKMLDGGSVELESAQYDRKNDSSFEIEFVVENTAYLLKATFRNLALQTEVLTCKKIFKSHDILKLRKFLKDSKPISSYDADKSKIKAGLQSYAFSINKKSGVDAVKKDLGFWFRFSEDVSFTSDYEKITSIESIKNFLPKIDNSVVKITALYDEDSQRTNSYAITFKNGETLTISDGDLKNGKNRLSHGTLEAVDFISMLQTLKRGAINFFYVDELLAHMNPELEGYLVRNAFLTKPKESQIFVTTHNVQNLELNVPANTFMFFRRNAEGFNEVIYPANKINKNDRNLKGYYDNDYFGVLPDYSALDTFFENGDAGE